MKWTCRTSISLAADRQAFLEDWHRWFAWKPTIVETNRDTVTVVWLKTIIRKGIVVNDRPPGWFRERFMKKTLVKTGYGGLRKPDWRWEYKENKGQLLREKIENGPPI